MIGLAVAAGGRTGAESAGETPAEHPRGRGVGARAALTGRIGEAAGQAVRAARARSGRVAGVRLRPAVRVRGLAGAAADGAAAPHGIRSRFRTPGDIGDAPETAPGARIRNRAPGCGGICYGASLYTK